MAPIQVQKVGMLGVGSMGAMLTLLMAEHGYEVHFFDPSEANMDKLKQQGHDIGLAHRVVRSRGYDDVCRKVHIPGQPKVFMFSTPHGAPADKCVEGLRPNLVRGDVIIDCGNELWTNTERRQRALAPAGIHYVGCGVSGGYQAARHGPSMSPGGDPDVLERLMPFLRDLAAKDALGRPCTAPVGPRGSGQYVKMVHNGIEQGMMSVVAEVWLMLRHGLGMGHEAVARVFQAWNEEPDGPLRDCFLVGIGADVERARFDAPDGSYVVDAVRDKVVQDVDEEEGTGTWTSGEAVALHVPAASILSAHLFRCASADLRRRQKSQQAAAAGGSAVPTPQPLAVASQEAFVEQLRRTTYFCFLACFAQGLDLIRAKDRAEGWGIDFTSVLQLWRGGCIIRADHIADVLEGMWRRPGHDPDHVLSNPEVAAEMQAHYPAVKQVVLKAVAADTFVPAIGQSLEYFKYETSTALPTQFMEAQLDYFGEHMFDDSREDPVGGPEKGRHHFEWKPATGLNGR